MILLHVHKVLIKIIMKMLNQMINAKRRAMIKGEMRMMEIKEKHHHILGDIEKRVTTRSRVINLCEHYSFVSSFEPFKVEDALRGMDWVVTMQEELNNSKRNEVWSLVERPKQNIVCSK
jgi:hypothetical protein